MIKKGQSGLTGMVATLVVVGVLIIIGVLVFSSVEQSVVTGADFDKFDENGTINNATGGWNDTAASVASNFYDANSLAVVALIVLAASVIIAILLSSFRA